jgi:transcriptional regulator of acetoin/glycerol metabolism
MPPDHGPAPREPDPAGTAEARERFLTAQGVDPRRVREPILASWRRSQGANVAADRVRLSYVRDPDLDTPLVRCALPILRNLREHLDGQPVSVILTDPRGVVLLRLTGDRTLERHLDAVQLAPGFSYAEEWVGTNGIGTALEVARPAQVFGHEHYAENLEDLACAAAPVRHPVTGRTLGALDLTCWRRDAGPLLVALVRATAEQIQAAVLAQEGAGEFALLREYLRACRRGAGAVLAFTSRTAMLNEAARRMLDPAGQAVVLDRAARLLASGRPGTATVDLPAGESARLHCRPVPVDGRPVGGVVHLGPAVPAAPVAARPASLPGVVGGGALWLRAAQQVDAAFEAGVWLAVTGEPGVGKLALLRAVQQRRLPRARLRVFDAAGPGRDWSAGLVEDLSDAATVVVLRHVDRLSPARAAALATLLRRRGTAGARLVAATLGDSTGPAGDLLALFPRTVEVPPLRHHMADLPDLVAFLLARLGTGGRLTCSPEAMQTLVRAPWPGNVEQVWQVLRAVVARRRAGVVAVEDLPPECWAVSRRVLSPLESMERDAIVAALRDTDGNKVRAAQALGMSRATIYRKIRGYGIVPPP